MLLAWQKNWGCPPGPPVPPTLDLCPEKIETTVILSNEIQRLPHLQRFGVTFTWACLVELLSRGHIALWILDKRAFNNYVEFWSFYTTYQPFVPWTWTKTGIIWTTYPPHLVHVVIERPHSKIWLRTPALCSLILSDALYFGIRISHRHSEPKLRIRFGNCWDKLRPVM